MTPRDRRPSVERLDEDVRAIADSVVEVREILERHGATLDQHTAILERHGATLERHGATLDQHTELLQEILRRLGPGR